MRGKVLLTGGLGNLGSWVTIALCEAGYDVYVLTRKENQIIKNCKYQIIEADITNLKELFEKLNEPFDYCIHMASYNEFFEADYAKKALEINALGTRNLLEVLVQNSIKKFIYLSTVHVYGKCEGMINENNVLSPQNDYATTHLFAEYYVKQFGETHQLEYTILRLSNSYGAPKFYKNSKWYLVLNDLVKSVYETQNIILQTNGQASRDFIWMGDVIAVLKKLLKCDCQGVYNLSSMQNLKIIEIAKMVQVEYEKRYTQKVNIIINNKDTTIYKNMLIDNTKLQDKITFRIHQCLSKEIHNIFDLLEGEK